MQQQEPRQLKEHRSVVITRPGGRMSSSRGTGSEKGRLHAQGSSLTTEQPLGLSWKIIPRFLAGLISLYHPGKKMSPSINIFIYTHTHI